MKTWLVILLTVLLVFGLIFLLSLISSAALLFAGGKIRKKKAKEDAQWVETLLPKTDCGACGFASCRECAQSTAEAGEFLTVCPALSPEAAEQISTHFAQEKEALREQRARGAQKNRGRKKNRWFGGSGETSEN